MSQSRSQRLSDEIIGDTPLVSVAFKLGWPAVATMYLIGSFNFIDTKFAGYLGETALAGISTGAFLYWDLIGLGNLVSIGTGAILARRMGERHQAEAERVAYQGVLASLIFSALVSAAFFLAAPWIFAHVMKTDPEVTRVGLSYLHIIVAGAPLIYLLITTNQIMQSLGDTRRPMELMIFALAVTIGLDYALMLGKWGAPAMGAPGAAVATVVSRGLYAVLALGMLASRRFYPGFRLSPHGSWGIDWNLWKRIAAIGLPTCVEATLFPAVYMVLVGYIVPFGNEHVAAMRVGHTIEGLTFFAALGMGMAMRPIVGQNLGAGQPERAEKAAWTGAAMLGIPVLAFSATMFFAPEAIASLITDDPHVVRASLSYLRIVSIAQIFMVFELVFVGAFSGAGETVTPMVIIVPLNLVRWPAVALAQSMGMGVEAVWWAISITGILKGTAAVAAFSLGRWKLKEI